MRQKNNVRSAFSLLICAALLCTSAWSQPLAKSVLVEPVAVVPSFNQWVLAFALPLAETSVEASSVQILPWSGVAPVQAVAFQPKPVIVGQPELPLLGEAAAQAARSWSSSLNYQGMHVTLVVLDAQGVFRQSRPINAPMRPGERFKLRVTSTFDAVASIDRLIGDAWTTGRAGQVYPLPGMSVQMSAGQTMDVPLGAKEYFIVPDNSSERLVLSIRHPQALGSAATSQPAYRQDGARGSNYLQLVPAGQFPAFEQVIAHRHLNR